MDLLYTDSAWNKPNDYNNSSAERLGHAKIPFVLELPHPHFVADFYFLNSLCSVCAHGVWQDSVHLTNYEQKSGRGQPARVYLGIQQVCVSEPRPQHCSGPSRLLNLLHLFLPLLARVCRGRLIQTHWAS